MFHCCILGIIGYLYSHACSLTLHCQFISKYCWESKIYRVLYFCACDVHRKVNDGNLWTTGAWAHMYVFTHIPLQRDQALG